MAGKEPKIGNKAPAFNLPSSKGKKIALREVDLLDKDRGEPAIALGEHVGGLGGEVEEFAEAAA